MEIEMYLWKETASEVSNAKEERKLYLLDSILTASNTLFTYITHVCKLAYGTLTFSVVQSIENL